MRARPPAISRWSYFGLAAGAALVVAAGACTNEKALSKSDPGSHDRGIATASQPVVIASEIKHDLSPPLRSMALGPRERAASAQSRVVIPIKPTKVKKKVGAAATPLEEEDEGDARNTIGAGPVADPVSQNNPPDVGAPVPGLGFEGVGNGFMGPDGTYTVNVAPPDNSGEIGPAHYVQMINLDFAIFDKVTGTPILGPRPNNSIWAGFGGLCETTNSGDPVVVYDQLADRWILSQFALSSQFRQCVAVSQTGDPTGAYYRYEFAYDAFPDYPKMGVWPDAYYITFNMFPGGSFAGAKLCAYDRAKMLLGQTATQQCFDLPSADSVLPADLDGATPPPSGAPGYFMNFDVAPAAHLNLWKLHVDWNTPANTTLTGPTSIPVAAFAEGCNGFGNCVPQPGTSQLLEGLGDRLLFRLAYRNFGDHESMVVTHNVAVGNAVGERWYEIRDPGGSPPTVFQQGTFAPGNTDPNPDHRWMGSIAMDKAGNIGLGYSISSTVRKPSIFFTGRLFSDPLGTMTAGEGSIIDGPAVQSGVARWGDYSQLTVDPLDDCTFWYTNQYQAVNGGFNWHTRIGSFQIGPCESGPAKLHIIKVNPASLEGGGSVQGTVMLTNLAPTGGLVVTLTSSSPTLAMVPASVIVPEGQQVANFAITTAQSTTQTDVTITGTLDAISKTAKVTLLASPTPVSVTLNPSSVMGSQTSTATVTLSGPAPTGGAVVTLTSSNVSAATVPANLTVAEGATSGTFTVTTTDQLVNTTSNISASYHGLTKAAVLTITRTIPVGNATFDPVLKAPRCTTVNSFCDTGGLIDGRDNILNGHETNQPNTINNSCSDGTLGSYHFDESQDRLKISTMDGSSLAPGKVVKVDATVFAYSNGDTWELYFAPNAASPVWTLLTTKPQVGSGLQVMTYSFVLPAGPLPAIRGVWRFQGTPGACPLGGYSEADDLIFAMTDEGGGDTTPPTTSITAPADGATVGAGPIPVNVVANDDVGVVKVELLVDGMVVATDTGSHQFTVSLATGAHTLQSRAFDLANNVGQSAVVHVTADATPPTTSITAPVDGALLSSNVAITAIATDNVSVKSVDLLVDGMVVATDTVAPYSFAITPSQGAHTLQTKAYDGADNSGLSSIVHVTYDFTAPTVAITAPVAGATVSGLVNIAATASDANGVASVQFSADGVALSTDTTSPYTAAWDATSATPGNHTLTAKAKDNAGLEATATITVVVAAPAKQYTFLEAESATLATPLQTVTDVNASGGKAVQAIPGNTAPNVTQPPANGHATIPFTVTGTGPYVIWGRVTAPTTADDSWWIRVDTGTWQRWNTIPAGAAYHWDDVHNDLVDASVPAKFTLAPGPHTLEFAYREDGTQLDRFLITNDLAFQPTGFGPPAAPTNVSANPGDTQVTLSWTTAAGGPTSYKIKRGATGGPYLTVKTGVTGTSTVDAMLTNGTKYCYVVSAVNANGEGPDSSPEQCATPVAPPVPQPPTNVSALGGNNQVTVTWTASTGATSYKLKRGPKVGPFSFLGSSTTVSFLDTTVMNGTEYCYVVAAVNGSGESADSALPVCVTPMGPVYLYPQAESAMLATTAPALQVVADTAASGGQAVQIPTGNVAPDPNNPPTGGHGTIVFTAPVGGNYKVWGRVTAPTVSNDSWWVRIDSGVWRRWNTIPAGAAYHWDDVHDDRAAPTGTGSAAVIFTLTAGSHTLEFSYREDGTRLDRFLITNDLAFTPSGSGP